MFPRLLPGRGSVHDVTAARWHAFPALYRLPWNPPRSVPAAT